MTIHRFRCAVTGGRGRAGLVGASLLSELYPGITSQDALAHVQGAYDMRNDGGARTIVAKPVVACHTFNNTKSQATRT